LVPIAVVEGDKLSETGSTDTAQTLAQLLPGLNYPQPALTDGTDLVRPATLRGLQPDEMLVLVDGKRRHTSALLNINTTVGRGTAGVDMSMLPAAAIERVEVLSDDAAAQYGSDAIAGVVNVLLKKQREGADVNVMYGQTYTNMQGVPEAVGVLTQPDGQPITLGPPANPVYALRYNGDREAHDGQTVSISGNVGLPLGSAGFLDIAGQGRDQAPTNRAGYDPEPQYPPLPGGLADPRELTFNRLSQRFGEPRIEDATLVANAGLPLGESGAEWYAFATYGARYALTTGFYRSASDPGTLTSLYPNGFMPYIKADINDESLVSGIRGGLGLWNYDLSANFGRDVMNFQT
jgi:iron complex outermembrane receptor protein